MPDLVLERIAAGETLPSTATRLCAMSNGRMALGDFMTSRPPPQPQEVRAFWTGPSLSLYEQLSLQSFVAAGAQVQLFSYERDLQVPDGVELIDATELLPGRVHKFRHASGDKSLALHSDLFRYVALEKFGGWYVDADVICIGTQLPTDEV